MSMAENRARHMGWRDEKHQNLPRLSGNDFASPLVGKPNKKETTWSGFSWGHCKSHCPLSTSKSRKRQWERGVPRADRSMPQPHSGRLERVWLNHLHPNLGESAPVGIPWPRKRLYKEVVLGPRGKTVATKTLHDHEMLAYVTYMERASLTLEGEQTLKHFSS